MNTTSLKQLLDTCFTAKRIVETLPELPKGIKPRHIHVLDAIQDIQKQQGMCRVSDVSTKLNITMPSITKLVQELESLGMLEKTADSTDKRVTLLCLTSKGRACVKRHVLEFHDAWAAALSDITDEQVKETIEIIKRLQQSMLGRRGGKNDEQ